LATDQPTGLQPLQIAPDGYAGVPGISSIGVPGLEEDMALLEVIAAKIHTVVHILFHLVSPP
jgi:hypothetical protein